jgi:hypothetical protein
VEEGEVRRGEERQREKMRMRMNKKNGDWGGRSDAFIMFFSWVLDVEDDGEKEF